jgi:predicted Zn-dependent protease
VELCRRGGFQSPVGGLTVFRCFDEMARQREGPGSQMEKFFSFMSTHPTPRDRALAVQERGQLMAAG